MVETVVVGGGVTGLSVAYHLAARGADDIVLLERHRLTSGTSWHAAGIVGPLRSSPGMTRLAMQALTLFPRLETETGMQTGFRRTGGYWLARRPERMDELRRAAAVGRELGLDARLVEPAAIEVPGLRLDDHVGALAVADDATVNPVDLCMAYARAATSLGVDIREHVCVAEIVVERGRAVGVRLADGSQLPAARVALCAGAWSRQLATPARLHLPMQAVEHMYVVTEPFEEVDASFPLVRDLDQGIYLKAEAGGLVIGGFESDAKCWDAASAAGDRPFLEFAEDWEQFAPFLDAALDLMPALERVGIRHFMNGPESFTVDTRPLVGLAPDVDGLYVAAGMNSVGIMSSAGIGHALADWMLDEAPTSDLWEIDVARADPLSAAPPHLTARMAEAVADQFAMHWPYRQTVAGRGLRTSTLHTRWADAGAVFGETAGWERPLWFARNDAERSLPYSVAAPQPWQRLVEREAAIMTHGVALFDLAPMCKFEVSGPEAMALLSKLTTADLTRGPGATVHALCLNSRGGIEADVTITCLEPDRYRLVGSATTRWRCAALLRRGLAGQARLVDVTEAHVVIGVMGANARSLLAALSADTWHDFAFSTSRRVELAGQPCRATRISYVGELGWEITVATERAAAVFDALVGAGARPAGLYAMDACRLEKGYLHWGHDIGPTITPLEAGLGYAIDWTKDFVGKPSLAAQCRDGLTRRLHLFDVEGDALILGDEPIRDGDRLVGFTTSGARGARTTRTLALGLVACRIGESRESSASREFQVEVAGCRYPARALLDPPLDPTGCRLRS